MSPSGSFGSRFWLREFSTPVNFDRSKKDRSPRLRCFHTWGNSGIEPYSGSGNQLSRNRQGPPHGALQSWRAAMEHYVGLDVSLKLTAICIVDQTGKIEREGMVASNPEAIAAFIKSHAPHVRTLRWCVRNVLPSALETASAPGDWLSRLNGWPMPSPTDASSASLQTPTHGSGPMWIATPSS